MTLNATLPRFRRLSALALPFLMLLGACQRPAQTSKARAMAGPTAAAPIQNPVLPGDFPDPSVTKIGDTYWATATSSNWGPAFPLLKSRNLREWELVGHVFPAQLPAWADYYFWAPEISQENGRTYIYYTAHRRGGNLAVGVASAARPEGPYTDHGPLVGQPDGSIDGFPMRDEQGRLYLIWKEDGNSVQQPTPIWAQPLNEARTALTGEKRELFRNDPATWEGSLVEGVSMVRHEGYIYAFYAGNGCCGSGCTYALGVARARTLLGPWEKFVQNPVLQGGAVWKCPGHGTAVEYAGHWYLLHHAYHAGGGPFVGRQGILSEFRWNADGWPVFLAPTGPADAPAPAAALTITDDFRGGTLQPVWQWPVEQRPTVGVSSGQLHLQARPDHAGAVLGQSTTQPDYMATVTLLKPAALPAGSAAGLAIHGDPDNLLALVAGDGKLRLLRREKGVSQVLAEAALPAAEAVQLRLRARQGSQFTFSWSTDQGRHWQPLSPAGSEVNGSYLPPWDRGLRAGLLATGPATTTAHFDDFRLQGEK